MSVKNGQKKMLGPWPTLFVGVGPCAERTLAEFSRLARRLTVRVQGPFGLVLVDSYCEDLFQCDWPWVHDFKIPESSVLRERSEFVGRDDARLLTLLSSLVRRLRSVGPTSDPTGPGRLRMNCTVLLDLSDAGIVSSAVRLMRTLRNADPALDVTVLGLTARTAATDSSRDSKWFEVWTLLLAELQKEALAHRVYVLDGSDADKTWFERPEQLHRLGAEFLLYHGLTCRGSLKQGERARTSLGENLLNVCGSFGCRTIHADLSVVAERLAERVAGEDLSGLYKRSMPDGWPESLDEQAQSFVDRIAGICEKAHQTKAPVSGERHDRAGVLLPGNTDVDEAIARAIKHVCSREPLASLCHFLRSLGPRLGKLLTRQRLLERERIRQSAAEAFRQQDSTTYEPMRTWLSQPETRWTDRFTPEQGEISHVAAGRPASRSGYLTGLTFLAIGLISILAGSLTRERLFVLGGGLLSLAASVLMTLPTGWVRHSRNRIREGQEISASIRPALYRKRQSGRVFCITTLLIIVGLAGLVWPLWPLGWTSISTIWAIVLTMIAGIGVAAVIGCPSQMHPERVSEQDAPGHVSPPAWRCRAAGMLCLALAWIVFCLGIPSPTPPQTAFAWIAHLVGLLLVGAGVGWALLPRTGRAYLIERVPKMPLPLTGGIGRPARDSELGHQIAAMADWIDRLSLEPGPDMGRSRATTVPRDRETLFDFLAADWEEQLAKAFRLALEARSGKSLSALALQPVLWAECITKELQNPRARCHDLTSLFALQAVNAWIESHTLAELLGFVQVDIERFGRLTARLASPHWPTSRAEPQTSVNVVAVAKPLWDVLEPLTQTADAAPIVPLDWDVRSDAMVVMRTVQGLAEGWRGFPGMPGQPQAGFARGSETKDTP